jgi:hypothetical protein
MSTLLGLKLLGSLMMIINVCGKESCPNIGTLG